MKYQRYNIPGHAHSLTFSCYRNSPLLQLKYAREIFCDSVNRTIERQNIHILAWVIMPNHIHLLLNPQNQDYSISKILKALKQSSSNRIIPYIKTEKPELLPKLETGLKQPRYRFWQDGGGYDRNIVSTKAIIAEIEYIHNNPVKKQLCDDITDWKWSSARTWELDEQGLISISKEYVY